MEFTVTHVIQLVVLIVSLVSGAIAVFKYIDTKQKDVYSEIGKLNTRINDVKDEYVKRPELDRELRHINSSIAELKTETRQALSEINSGLRGLQESVTHLATALVTKKSG